MTNLTLAKYQEAERELAVDEGRRGFSVHALITAIVCAGLVVLNITVASEFPWSIFPVIGMGIGLLAHWYFGVARVVESVERHQDTIARKAAA